MPRSTATSSRMPARPQGRPRDVEVDAAIRNAVIHILREDGYAGVTIQGVAQRAGVGHTSVYRRWGSKARMVHEVVFPDEVEEESTEVWSFDDLVAVFVNGVVQSLGRPEARAALVGLMVDWDKDPELQKNLAQRFEPALRARLRSAAKEAAKEGRVRADLDVDALIDTIIGAAMARAFGPRGAASRLFASSLTDLLRNGFATGPTA